MRKLLPLVCVLISLVACNQQQVYSEFHSVEQAGWHIDSLVKYTVDISDSTARYELVITLRHTTQYPYQNIWLFVDKSFGNTLLQRDTVEGMMADNYGRWLGKGIMRYTLPLLYDDACWFPCSGEYTFSIQQGMRTECLQGISDVGLQVVKYNGKE